MRVLFGFFLLSLTTNAYSNDLDRGKKLNFEDTVVEGVNKKPLDSLSQLSEKDRKRRNAHLYKKREDFRDENAITLQEIRFLP